MFVVLGGADFFDQLDLDAAVPEVFEEPSHLLGEAAPDAVKVNTDSLKVLLRVVRAAELLVGLPAMGAGTSERQLHDALSQEQPVVASYPEPTGCAVLLEYGGPPNGLGLVRAVNLDAEVIAETLATARTEPASGMVALYLRQLIAVSDISFGAAEVFRRGGLRPSGHGPDTDVSLEEPEPSDPIARIPTAGAPPRRGVAGPVGISLSGGGLRAAAFGLGATQALQQERGLIKGESRAEFLTAVSGGSYTAAAITMAGAGACGQPQQPDTQEIGKNLRRQAQRAKKSGREDIRIAERPIGPDGHPVRYMLSSEEADEQVRRYASGVASGPFGLLMTGLSDLLERDENLREAALAKELKPSIGTTESVDDDWRTVEPSDPFSPGSPEANFVRKRTTYFTDNAGLLRLIARYAGTTAWNVLVIVTLPAVAGVVVGLLLGLSWESPEASGPPVGIPLRLSDFSGWWPTAAVITGIAAAGWGLSATPNQVGSSGWQFGKRFFSVITVGMVLLVGVLPWLLVVGWNQEPPTALGDLGPGALSALLVLTAIAASAGIAALVSFATSRLRHNSSWRFLLAPVRLVSGATLFASGYLLLPAGLSLVAVLASAFGFGATAGAWEDDIVAAGLGLSFFVVLGAFAFGPNSWSLHHPYRARLFSCFGVLRQAKIGDAEQTRAVPRHKGCEPLVSKSRGTEMPDLLICAAANVSTAGIAPAGTSVLPFVIGQDFVHVTTDPDAKFGMSDLETALRVGESNSALNLTLPAAVALTGAAVSPAMGKLTAKPFRALMTLLNLRLGLWLPNPMNERMRERVRQAAQLGENPLFVLPGPIMLFREMFGLMGSQSKYVYVTDGGHDENLGLVELFRRGCQEIWCVDASGDAPGSAKTLAEALMAGAGELGVTCDIDLDHFALEDRSDTSGSPRVRSTYARGVLSWRRGNEKVDGILHVIKLGVSEQTSSLLKDYQRRRPSFPYDSTANQIYDADLFDAYRELGYDSAMRASRAAAEQRVAAS